MVSLFGFRGLDVRVDGLGYLGAGRVRDVCLLDGHVFPYGTTNHLLLVLGLYTWVYGARFRFEPEQMATPLCLHLVALLTRFHIWSWYAKDESIRVMSM